MEAGFSCFVAISGYSSLTFNPEHTEIWSCLKHIFKATIICDLKQLILFYHKVDSPGLFANGPRIHSFPVRGLLWLGSSAQTLLKAEIGAHTPAGRKKALAQSPSKSLLMLETCQKSQCSLITHIIPVWLWMQPLYLPTWTQLSFSPEVTDWVPWPGWVCHLSKQVLWPILRHWNVLPVVTVFLKEISGVALVTQKHWPVIHL